MSQYLLTLILITTVAVNCAAQSNPGARDATARQEREQTISTAAKQVSDLDDPLLRVFLRNELISYLWESSSGTGDAVTASTDALADIRTLGNSVPASLMKTYRRSFCAKLQQHAPTEAAKLCVVEKVTSRNELESAYAMLNTQGGVEPAVERARTVVKSGKDPGHLISFFLLLLEQKSPERVPQMLSEILAIEEVQPGTLSVKTLFSINHFYLDKQTQPELQNRYLAALVKAIKQKSQWANTDELTDAYGLMQGALPLIEKQQPALFNAASERATVLAAQLPTPVLERMLINDRVMQSPDPLNQLLNEIEIVRDKGLKEELLMRAAQMSLQQGMPSAALDLVSKVQFEGDEKLLWRDQFIERIAVAAAANDPELTNRALARIQSPLTRAYAFQQVALRQNEAKRPDEAKETLLRALSSVDKSLGGTDKALAISELASTYCKLDAERAPEMARAFVSAVNSLPAEGRPAANSGGPEEVKPEEFLKIVRGTNALFRLIASTSRDERDAMSIAQTIKRKDLKTTAFVGASIGILNRSKLEQASASVAK